jgi:hypothetical protein
LREAGAAEELEEMNRESPVCPHCGESMLRWQPPADSAWTSAFMYVCFSDECPYFVRGWRWMKERFDVVASYRFRIDPETSKSGPLPVWSPHALRDSVLMNGE